MKELEKFIKETVRNKLKVLLKEAEEDTTQPTTGTENTTTTDSVDTSGGGLEDLVDDTSTTDTGDSETGTSETSGDEGDDSEDDFDFGDFSAGGGSSSSGGGSSGGGFDFGFDSDGGGDNDSDSEEGKEADTSTVEISDDPIQGVVDLATSTRIQTGDAQQILNVVKAAIQEKFQNFDDAETVIQLLWDTGEPVLQTVARKLILFIKGN